MTDQPTGRALAEAAARAMGWHLEMGGWFRGDGTFAGNTLSDQGAARGCLTERECLAWLHERGDGGGLVTTRTINKTARASLCIAPDWEEPVALSEGVDLREALARLVVAVAEREASRG